jgi:hypothetical protein
MITLALKIKPILEELPKINQKAAIRKIYIDSSVRNETHVGGYGREGFNYIADSIKSARPHKCLHEWQQSTDEVEYIIRGLTVENEVILDPMLGSGTTAIAPVKLNRKFIGIEIEKHL